tara:strand:+ start:1167 stop:2471 length:1305 start_codon:yes stop_codon:yes gene_type:complete
VDEGGSEPNFESRLKESLEKLDIASKKALDSIKSGAKRTKEKVKETSDNFDSTEFLEKTKAGISAANEKLSSAAKKVEVGEKASSLKKFIQALGYRVQSFSVWLISFAPFIIPSIILLQTAIWVAYLSDGTSSNEIISDLSSQMGEYQRLAWLVGSIFGAAIGFLIVANFDSTLDASDTLEISPVFDVIVILLVVSSILYLLKSNKSLYYLSLAFLGSLIIRMVETDITNYNWLLIILCTISLFGSFSALSITFIKNRISNSDPDVTENVVISDIIETSAILTENLSEVSYLGHPFDDIEWNMDNAPIAPPKRPSRRSEYELYEWVGLLANIILWPTTLGISMLIGSGTEIDGTALTMEDNYIMLLGPALMTAFFFVMQFRMDASARDGSLYAAQKQAYLDEMEKYVEAKKAYLELVTLQAQVKKEQLMDGESE